MNITIKANENFCIKVNSLMTILEKLDGINEEFKLTINTKASSAVIDENTANLASAKIIYAFAEGCECDVLIQKNGGSKASKNEKSTVKKMEKTGQQFFENLLIGKVNENDSAYELFNKLNSEVDYNEHFVMQDMEQYLIYARSTINEEISRRAMEPHFGKLKDQNYILNVRKLFKAVFGKEAENKFSKMPSIYEFLKAYNSVYNSMISKN